VGNIFPLFLLGCCFISINMLFIVATGLIRYMPQIVVAAARLAIATVRLSIHVYNAAFQRLAPSLYASAGFELSRGWGRLVASVFLSLLLALAIYLLIGQRFPVLVFGSGLLHGLVVNHLWDRVLYADYLRMGEEAK
jgi:hypothetical protein